LTQRIIVLALDESAGTLSAKEGSAMKRVTAKEKAQVIEQLVKHAATALRRAAIIAESLKDDNGWFLARLLDRHASDAEDALCVLKHLKGGERNEAL
jgi:hypothetical protein